MIMTNTYNALVQEVKLLRDDAATLRQLIRDLHEALLSAHEAVNDAELGNADRIEALEAELKALQSVLRDQADPRVAAAAVIFKALTGREQPMDRTAEDVIAELKILVDQSGSEIWEAPPRYVSIQYAVTVSAMLPPNAPQDREALDAWLKGGKISIGAEAPRDSSLAHVWVMEDRYTGFEAIPPGTINA